MLDHHPRGSGIHGAITVCAAFLLLATGCAPGTSSATKDGASPSPVAQCDLNSPPPAAPSTAPASSGTPPKGAEHALHNVHRIGGKMISGAVPDGDAAFDELKSMGVKTIISVDGATPDVVAAESRGIRYVHIPITYAEVTEAQTLEIARAVRDLPGPIYIHCHHGKHRSPAATAAVAVALGEVTPDEGVAFMKSAGTAANYKGLYACVAAMTLASAAEIDAAPADFPTVRKPAGMVGAMVDIDQAFEHLGEIRAAGWTVPADHPDLVPAAEAGRIADHLRFSGEDPEAKALGDDFMKLLAESMAGASELEEALVRGEPKDQLESRFKLVQQSCKECHASYRDNRPRTKW